MIVSFLNKEVKDAFNNLKKTICMAPILAMPNFQKEFKIECDATGGEIGTVLSQEGWRMAYLSKRLSPKHLDMSVYEKYMIAVVYAIKKWCSYLIGRHFKIYTNHLSLKYMLEQHISIPMQQKWLSKLIGYDFEICFRSGKENKVVDSLSIMNEPSKKAIMMVIPFPLTDWVEQLKQELQQDVEI